MSNIRRRRAPGARAIPPHETRRMRIAMFIYHALFLLIVYIIQAMLLPFVTALPSVPLILPLAAVGAAMFEGGGRGAAMGLLAGALCDISMNQPIAAYALLFTLMCLVIGVLSDAVLAPGFFSYLLLCLAALALCAFTGMFTLLFFEGVDARELLLEAGLQTAVSLPFTPLTYLASRALVARRV